MKIKTAKANVTTLICALSVAWTCSAYAAKGTNSGGGGYKYTDTAYPNINEAKYQLAKKLAAATDEEVSQVATKMRLDPVTKEKLAEIIQKLKLAPLEDRSMVVDGFEQPKDMDYSVEGQYIVALKPLFESIDKLKLSDKEQFVLQRKIIHEASHLFNIGIEDDSVSEKFSFNLMSIIEGYHAYCGLTGSLEERKSNCSKLFEINSASALGPVVYNVDRQEKIKILDTRPLFGHLTLLAELKTNKMPYPLEVKDIGSYLRFAKDFDPEDFCAKEADTLGGKISWKAVNFEQISSMDQKTKYFRDHRSQILFPGNRVLKREQGAFKEKLILRDVSTDFHASVGDTIGQPKDWYYTKNWNTIMCVGTVN